MSGTDDTTNILEDDELANEHGDGSPGIGGGDGGAVEEFNLTEALVEQMIHTIEYALGCISHTVWATLLPIYGYGLYHLPTPNYQKSCGIWSFIWVWQVLHQERVIFFQRLFTRRLLLYPEKACE